MPDEIPPPPKVIVPDANFPKREADNALSGEKDALGGPQDAADRHKENEQLLRLRENFSIVVAVFVFLWMAAIYALLIFQGIRRLYIWPQYWFPFDLSEKVLLAALGTVTLNIVGLLAVVIKFVFPEKKSN